MEISSQYVKCNRKWELKACVLYNAVLYTAFGNSALLITNNTILLDSLNDNVHVAENEGSV